MFSRAESFVFERTVVRNEGGVVFKLAGVFFIIALIAALFGFATVVASATATADMVFAIFLGVTLTFLAASMFSMGSGTITFLENRRRVPQRESANSRFLRSAEESPPAKSAATPRTAHVVSRGGRNCYAPLTRTTVD
jgi:uncharacterized membrane protein YtjA (UPF0391 family)